MATQVGAENSRLDLAPVRQRLFAEPWTFEFFQAVRLLALLDTSHSQVGFATNPENEPVRFGAHASLSFPASQIQALTGDSGASRRMEINFLGVVGPSGILPRYVTEFITHRVRSGDTAMREFFNIFNHRLTSFFYRAWEKHHFTVGYERDRRDPITGYLFALVGLGSPLLRNRSALEDTLLLFHAGLFGLSPKPAVALEAAIGDYFGVPVEVEPFIGTWRALGGDDQCHLNESEDSDMLGWGAVIGDEVWDVQSRIRIRLGPLDRKRYRDFLPSGSAWKALCAIARMFCGNDLEFEIQLILKAQDVPPCVLGDPEADGPALGWGTWIKSQPVRRENGVVIVGG